MQTINTYIQQRVAESNNPIHKEWLHTYAALPIPNKKMEDWKFYDSQAWFNAELLVSGLHTISKDDVITNTANILHDALLVFENGQFVESLSQPGGGIASHGGNAPASENGLKDDKFAYLNALVSKDGAHITISAQQSAQHILILSFFSGAESIACLKHHIQVQSGASATITEIQISPDNQTIFAHTALDIICDTDSTCNYTCIQKLGNKTHCIQSIEAHQQKNTNNTIANFPISGEYIRTEIYAHKHGEFAHTYMNGIFFPAGEEHFETYIWANHHVPHCETHQLYKGLAKDKGLGVFSGKVHVAKDAQQTNTTQSNKNMILSPHAKIHSKPQLEIYADDVSCSHGSTTGQIDAEALWYMQARGLSKETATQLLLAGFIADVTNTITKQDLQETLIHALQLKLR
jgi:Fe-S cluster assembly protein SufD